MSLIERYSEQIVGVLSCYDRIIIQGTLPGWCFDQGMTSFLNAHHIIKSGLSYSNINISCNAFKLFFNKVLNYNWSDDVIVRPKRPKKLPSVLSKDEILSIMDQVNNLKHKVIF
ncbi:hypothetical protein JCM15765_02030 [Paradesulfitobacterium aromaticivorans]